MPLLGQFQCFQSCSAQDNEVEPVCLSTYAGVYFLSIYCVPEEQDKVSTLLIKQVNKL